MKKINALLPFGKAINTVMKNQTRDLAFLIMLISIMLLKTTASYGQFSDGFESGSYSPTWTLSGAGATASVISSLPTPPEGTKCLKLTTTGGTFVGSLTTSFAPTTPIELVHLYYAW